MSKIVRLTQRSPLWWVGWVPGALLFVLIIAFAIVAGRSVLVPLVLGFTLAFLLEPVTNWIESHGQSRTVAALLSIAAAIITLVLLLVFLLPSVIHQLVESFQKIPAAIHAVGGSAQRLLGWAREHLSSGVFERLQTAVAGLQNDTSAIFSRMGTWLSSGLLGLVNLSSSAVGLVIVPFFVFYLLCDLNHVRQMLEEHIPIRYRSVGVRLLNETGDVVRGYVQGRVTIALIMATIYALGLLILQVPLWAAIGVIAGIVGIIPYLGVLSGLALAIGFAALDGAGFGRILGVGVVFTIAQLTEDYVLTPRIIGNKLELHPMIVFIALIVAGDLFGLLGLVLAIPVVAVLKVILRFLDEQYLNSNFYLKTVSESQAVVIEEDVLLDQNSDVLTKS